MPNNQATKPASHRKPKPPFPEPRQKRPGLEIKVKLRPQYEASEYKAAGKLEGKVALITGSEATAG
ncbi:MAG: hypothetical protein AB1757_01185 [Acidobacteriota bacterium]